LATLVNDQTGRKEYESWNPESALKHAWFWYGGLMAVPTLTFIYMMWWFLYREPRTQMEIRWTWLIGTVAFMVIAIPLSIFARSRLFRAYWQGECVAPRAYLAGMIIVWSTIVVSGIASMIGCMMTGTFLPNLVPALVAFVVYLTMWPSGRVMIHERKGIAEDPEHYEEPR